MRELVALVRMREYVALEYVKLEYVTVEYVTLEYVTIEYVTKEYVTLEYVTLLLLLRRGKSFALRSLGTLKISCSVLLQLGF